MVYLDVPDGVEEDDILALCDIRSKCKFNMMQGLQRDFVLTVEFPVCHRRHRTCTFKEAVSRLEHH